MKDMTARGRISQLFSILIFMGMLTMLAFPITQSEGPIEEEPDGTPEGWSDDINLSNSSMHDKECEIYSFGDNIYAVWINDWADVAFSKSNDGGKTWAPSVNLYHSNAFLAFTPEVVVSEENIHVVWGDRDGWDGIYYRNSTDNGDTWNLVKRISPVGVNAYGPHIFVNKSNVHISWHDKRDGADGEIYYRRSLDSGITFDNGQGVDVDRRITFSPAAISGVQMAGDGSNISVAWADERDGDWEIYWMISKDNGFTWEDGLGTPNVGRIISDSVDDSVGRSIAVDGPNIHIVWYEEQWPGPVYRIYYRNSTDNGVTWNPIQFLSGPNSASFATNIDVDGDNVWVMWNDNRDGSHEVFYKNSSDGGITWGSDTRLTEMDGFLSGAPKIALEDFNIHVIWEDERDGNTEIYYKRFPDFPPDPTYNITLNEGWNLISSPLIQSDESLDKALENITGKWDYILAYNSTDPDHWKSNATFKPDILNDLKILNHKMAFWINITEPNVTLTVSGLIPTSTTIPLYAGWNLVSYPTQTTETVANALWGTGADRVEVFNASQPYNLAEVGPTYIMKPGEGYWVHVVADSVWVVDW